MRAETAHGLQRPVGPVGPVGPGERRALAARAGGRRLGTDELGLPEQEELQEAAASQVCGWSGGRPWGSGGRALGLQPDLGGGTEGAGSCLPGLGHCGRCGIAFPKGNGWKGQAVVQRVMPEATAGHRMGTVRGVCALFWTHAL